MITVIRAELQRFRNRRTLAGLVAGAVLLAVVGTLTVWSSATDGPAGRSSRQAAVTLGDLAAAGGGSEAFGIAASFVGFVLLVVFAATFATEYAGGTMRALLLREPHRIRLLLGKLAGVLAVVAVTMAGAQLLSFALSMALAPGKDVSTDAWFTLDGLVAGVGTYASVLAGVAGWALFGTALGVVFRSAPLALGVGIAWAGPLENITVDSWSTGFRVFPGQVLNSVSRGGTVELGLGRAALTATLYAAIAATVALTLAHRRDVTA